MNPPEKSAHVVVVGGGISGLAAAHYLATHKMPVTVFEAADHVGGKLVTIDVAGISLDGGAESVLARRHEATDLIAAVGLKDSLVHPSAGGAAVWIDDALRRLPQRQLLGIPYDLAQLADSKVLDKRGLLRVYAEASLPKRAVESDTSVGQLVKQRLGIQVVERLVEPVLAGVYASSADQLSLDMTIPGLRAHLTDGVSIMEAIEAFRREKSLESGPGADGDRPALASLVGGVGQLPSAIASTPGVSVATGANVQSIQRSSEGWTVTVLRGGETADVHADAVVLACQSDVTSRLLAPFATAASSSLAGIEYASVAVASYVFDKGLVPTLPAGTGFLVPPVAGRTVKAVTFSSQKWQWLQRQHPEHEVIRVSVGRHGDTAILQRSDDELAAVALADMADMTGVNAQPLDYQVTRWTSALPQYRVGHRELVEMVRNEVSKHEGLALCGAGLDGVGIAACVASGQAAGTRIREMLTSARR
ncbi:MAG: protoporphyrinogen oxidase [Candidatus Nanopelagicales bacterium]